MESLPKWIEQELNRRGWRPADLARRAHIRDATLSRVLSGSRRAGPDVCTAIAEALEVPPERVFRIAGLLPPLPAEVEEEREALSLFRSLGRDVRQVILTTMRSLLDRTGPAASRSDRVDEQPAAVEKASEPEAYRRVPTEQAPETWSEWLAWGLARQLEGMPPEDQRKVFDLLKRLRDDRGGNGESGGVPLEPAR